MGKFRRRNIILNGFILILIAGIAFFGYRTLNPKAAVTAVRTATASVGTVSSTVSASGTVQSATDAGLSFKSTGIVKTIYVKVGDTVAKGKVLAAIDDTQAKIALMQAQASEKNSEISVKQAAISLNSAQLSVDKARSDYDTLIGGPSDATKKSQAQALVNAQNSLTSTALAVQSARDAITLQESTTATNLAGYDRQIDRTYYSLLIACGSVDDKSSCKYSASGSIRSAYQSWEDATLAKTAGVLKDQQNLDAAKATLDSALRNQNAAQSSYDALVASQSDANNPSGISIKTSKTTLDNAAASYDIVKMQADQASANLLSAQASLLVAQQNYEGTKIVAPISGTIGAIASTVGMNPGTVSSGSGSSGFIILTNLQSLQVKASVAEADIANLSIGQTASITFDAVSSARSQGTVISVAPINTSSGSSAASSSVQSYTVLFSVDQAVASVKPGMTAQVSVTTKQVDNVLYVPTTAITQRGSFYTVTLKPKKEGTAGEQVRVTVGLQGDSRAEIQGGIKEGDEVVLRTTTSSSSSNGFPAGGIPGGATGRNFPGTGN